MYWKDTQGQTVNSIEVIDKSEKRDGQTDKHVDNQTRRQQTNDKEIIT